jgi:hypothetical protein
MTIFELDLHIPMMYPYMKFELDVCNRCRDYERKLMMTEQGKVICPGHFMAGA